MITLAALFTYPVKSCRGTQHESALLEEAGLAHDREWMFVTPGGRFLTQREEPRVGTGGCIRAARRAPAVRGGRRGGARAASISRARGDVTVWRDRVSAFDQGDEPAAWISSLLGRDARLVRIDPAARRRCDPAWTADTEAHSRFSDGYPLLVVSRASLDDLEFATAGAPADGPLPSEPRARRSASPMARTKCTS